MDPRAQSTPIQSPAHASMQAATQSSAEASAVPVRPANATVRAEGPWTVSRLLVWISAFLTERKIDSPRFTAEILLTAVLKIERIRLYMEPGRELDSEELSALRALVARAGKGEPLQFLVGRWQFFGHDFLVAPCTLIPRPSTETLVQSALEWYRARGGGSVAVLDLCTGTGCIAVTLALAMRAIARPSGAGCRPLRGGESIDSRAVAEIVARNDGVQSNAEQSDLAQPEMSHSTAATALEISVVATDLVADAVALARENARRLGASIDARVGDVWAPITAQERFDLIVSNPPYVTDAEYDELDHNVRGFEPATALRGGADGLDLVRRVVDGAAQRLNENGLLLVEIGWKHGDAARALVSGPHWRGVDILKDGDGLDRVLHAQRTELP